MSLTLTASGDELRAKFFALQSRTDIADLLDIDENHLIYYLYILPPHKRYKTFNIAKSSGAKRQIDAPLSALKIIQRKFNQVLQYVYPAKPSVHGFIQNKNILTNARVHLARRNLLNVDLKDFFPSINFGRVRGMFMARPYNLNKEVATILAQICCFNNYLPQGAPTSPTISNMICAKLDDNLQQLAKKYKCLYTRYADDITFSTHLLQFSTDIIFFDNTGTVQVGPALLKTIKSNGFEINLKKVKIQPKSLRQQVTGIKVNKIVNVKREYINQIRAMLHAWEKYGLDAAEAEFIKNYNTKKRLPIKNKISFPQIVKGKIEYLGMVKGKENPTYLKFYDQYCKLSGIKNNRKTIAHLSRYNTIIPRITTEGKTDWKHLKTALNKLQSNGKHTNLRIEFYEYEDNMPAGSARVKEACENLALYRQDTMNIFIFDNDEKDITKKVTERDEKYKTWGNNVFSFVIPVPEYRKENPDICIELYYRDEEIKRTDKSNRRLFLSSEFNSRSGWHKTEHLSCQNPNKIRNPQKINLIDDDVFNREDKNVCLSKSDFATYVLNQEDNFNDFDYSEFEKIFDVIQLIIDKNLI